MIMRKLKQLENVITLSVVKPEMLENGWEFGEHGDPLYNLDYAYQLYLKADANYEGRANQYFHFYEIKKRYTNS